MIKKETKVLNLPKQITSSHNETSTVLYLKTMISMLHCLVGCLIVLILFYQFYWCFQGTSISTEYFYFTYFKDSSFRRIVFWRDVMGLHNDVSCCVITLYISFFLYTPGSDCFGCSIGVTTSSLICCRLFCWNVGDIKIELSNMYPRPKVCNKLIGLLIFFSACCRIQVCVDNVSFTIIILFRAR